jgi:putative (di)nucleoside polyphosphate hydrolase
MRQDFMNLPLRNGVGIMVINKEKKVFVGKRIDNQEAWQMPQGGVDNNEDIKSAALRELYEETGITSVKIIAESKYKYSYLLPENLEVQI